MEPSAMRGDITRHLVAWSQGDSQALDALIPLVYDELRRMARRHMRRESAHPTLPATGLVHDAFLRLARQRNASWQNRAHFYAIASQAMRRILVDHARERLAKKRGEGGIHYCWDERPDADQTTHEADALLAPASTHRQHIDLLALDEALSRLEKLDPQQSRVVELRFFGGLSVEETAQTLSISPATVKREWATARLWLLRQLGGGPDSRA